MAQKFFTQEEIDNIIKDYNYGDGLRPYELAKKYNRNPSSISNKLKSLGIYKYTSYRFTDEDIEFLKENYPSGDWEIIMSHFPHATKQSVMTKASKLGIKMMNENAWTKDELDIVKKYYESDIKLVQKLLPNRSYKAIVTKAKRIGIKSREFWSDEEETLMREVYPILPVDEVVKKISKSNKKFYHKTCNSIKFTII